VQGKATSLEEGLSPALQWCTALPPPAPLHAHFRRLRVLQVREDPALFGATTGEALPLWLRTSVARRTLQGGEGGRHKLDLHAIYLDLYQIKLSPARRLERHCCCGLARA